MMRKMPRFAFLLLFALIAALPAAGGTVTLTFNQHATQNLFQTKDAVADQISTFSLAVNQDLAAFTLSAKADYAAFRETTGLSFFAADLGADYLVTAGPKSAFYFAAGAAGQFYGPAYGSFSSLGGNLVGAFKTYLAPSSILKLQAQGQYASYNDSLFDSASVTASMSADKYFPSRTTLKAEGEWGYKYFLHPYLPEPAEAPMLGTVPAAGPGPGSGQYGAPSAGSGGGWGGQRYPGGEGFIPRYSGTGGGAGIGHVSVSLLAGQGFGDVLGLSVSGLRQWVVAGQNPFMSIEEFYYVQNPSADSFSWQGRQVNGRITVHLPWDLALHTGYTYSDKTYPGVESLSLDGEPLGFDRNDRRRLAEARLQKDFRRFSIFLAYSYVDNRSTDPLFVWKSHFVMGGVEWNLPFGRKGAA
jgi:hypothetical protein